MMYRFKPVMHVVAAGIVGTYSMLDAFKNSRTTQLTCAEIQNDPEVARQILRRHTTMRRVIGVDMDYQTLNNRFNRRD